MQIQSIFQSVLFLALTAPTTAVSGQGTDVLACWDFSGLTPDQTLSDGQRVSDSCGDRDARVAVGLEVIEGVIPGAGALAFASASADALVFEPEFDFGDGGPPAGEEFDFTGGDNFTLEAVVRIPPTFTAIGSILAKDVGPGQASWWFRLHSGLLQALVSDGSSQSITGSQVVNDGQWHHVALVRDAAGNSLNLYVDYQLDESVTTTPLGDITTPDGTSISLGGFNAGSHQLQGDMQTARITRDSLPPDQFLLHDEVANLSVAIHHDGEPLSPGETTQYEITVSNAGPMATDGVAVEALMPAEFAGTTWTCTADSGSSCSASGNGDLIDSVDLLAGQSVLYTVQADLVMDLDLPHLMTYTASIEPGEQIDFSPDANMASVTTWVDGGTEIVLHVDQSAASGGDGAGWATAFRYLQDALAEARVLTSDGGRTVHIWVARGVYYPDEGAGQPNNSRIVAFELADAVELYGGFNGTEIALEQRDWLANPTVLSGDITQDDIVNGDGVTEHWEDIVGNNSFHVVRGSGLSTAVLDGFTVTGGQARPSGGGDIGGQYSRTHGAAIHLLNSAATIRNLRVQGNVTWEQGGRGALYMNSASHITLHLTNATFENNQSYWGGAIAVLTGRIVADHVRFHGNRALDRGGALYQHLGLYIFYNSVFMDNSAQEGGAIFSYNRHAALVNSLISGNYASNKGGGIYFWDQSGISGALVLTNSTIAGNRAGNLGGAIYRARTQEDGQNTEASNTIIWDNQDSTGVGTPSSTHGGSAADKLVAAHSLLHGLDPDGENNFDGTDPTNAPAFLEPIDPVDAPTRAGNFRIHDHSPLMDAGTNQARINPNPGIPVPNPPIPIEGNILFDLDGTERFVDGNGDGNEQIDLGPYEVLGVQGRSIGGTVSGLAGSGLVLRNNGGDDLPIAADGGFTFATSLADGSGYDVTVSAQPTGLSQTCSVSNATGVVDGADVIDVQIDCVTDTFTVGGTVSGLSGNGLVLQNNGGDDLPIAADGGFTFATSLADGSGYDVTVSAQPTGLSQTCSVSNASGVVDGANVIDVQIDCVTDTFTVGGTVSGLSGNGLLLQNNGGDDMPIAADGGFTFATSLADGSGYDVTVSAQPTGLSQTCSVSNASGVVDGADVIDVQIDCVTDTFTVGGTVSGLSGNGLLLQNNGDDDLPISDDGNFTFATALTDGSPYDVTVSTQPTDPSQTCSVSNGTGVVDGEDITDIEIDCVTDTFSLGGTVSGLSGTGLVLRNNGGDDLAIESDGTFEFEIPLPDGTPYRVTVWSQPTDPAQHCTVVDGEGVVEVSDITDIAVNCVDSADMIFSDRYEN